MRHYFFKNSNNYFYTFKFSARQKINDNTINWKTNNIRLYQILYDIKIIIILITIMENIFLQKIAYTFIKSIVSYKVNFLRLWSDIDDNYK